MMGGGGGGVLDGCTGSRGYWGGGGGKWGGFLANLSIVQFRVMMLGIHVYVHIGYMFIETQ
jgi:hypothetical protein